MNWGRAGKVALLFALLLVVGAFIVQAFPFLVGAEHALTVQSGSMEPAIGTGSVVFVADSPPEQVTEGDIITYADDGGDLVTHRVIEKHEAQESLRFVTKGDANENADSEPVYRPDYVGKVQFNIPLMGYVVAFGQSKAGWFALVILPTVLLVLNEIWGLYKALEPAEDKET